MFSKNIQQIRDQRNSKIGWKYWKVEWWKKLTIFCTENVLAVWFWSTNNGYLFAHMKCLQSKIVQYILTLLHYEISGIRKLWGLYVLCSVNFNREKFFDRIRSVIEYLAKTKYTLGECFLDFRFLEEKPDSKISLFLVFKHRQARLYILWSIFLRNFW